ncbi:Rieske 2Fe-2S domain-containing protein [Nocardia cyriacigeorgica]|uniref:Rieske 2Fe-2S domain-containing protein n=1 Tax=Nocardia cyriacigeorgica TaxID=135487 RepID=UPI001895A8B2|nr:Rieske 2Fe-2S domain-containing protein [Nocardia cyriacigeorgica]MBF6413752.1 Rieske (2Fe-2S) protein [Nocardia cyriacigeorgica]
MPPIPSSSALHARAPITQLESPNGWFAVGWSRECRPGSVLTTRLNSREIVVFRTESGILAAADAYCPHLGAHLGRGGRVVQEELRCPFHGFRFSTTGACTHNPYGTPPPAARLGTIPVLERYGAILVYSGPDATPAWEPPDDDSSQWRGLLVGVHHFRGHPQEVTENSVDLGHLRILHAFGEVRTTQPLTVDGPLLRAGYGIRRRMIGRIGMKATFDLVAAGLGVSIVELTLPAFRVRLRLLVLPTLVSGGKVVLRLAVSSRHSRNPLTTAISAVLARVTLAAFSQEVRRDIDIWRHKTYLARPAIADGDGQIGRYRQWVRQFYTVDGAQ